MNPSITFSIHFQHPVSAKKSQSLVSNERLVNIESCHSAADPLETVGYLFLFSFASI